MKRTIRLRLLLLLLVLVAVAPGIAVMIYSSIVVQRDEINRARVELGSVAKLVAANQEQLIEGVRQILATVAAGPSVRRDDLHDLCDEFLRNVQVATSGYANIGLLDLQANIQCQALGGDRAGNGANRRYFRNAIQTGQFAIGEYAIGFTSGRKILGFGTPVYDYHGALRGVAFAALDLEFANRQLKSIALPKQFTIHVTDGAGHVLVSSGDSAVGIGAMLSEPTLRAAVAAGRTGDFDASDTQGVAWLHVLKPLTGTGRDAPMVIVSLRRSDAVAIANTHFQAQLMILAAASLLGFVMAWLLARRSLAQPVARLLERMRRVEQGEAPLPDDRGGIRNAEFAELDDGFTSMLARLQTNQQQMLRAQEITRVGFFQLDLQSGHYSASPILIETLGITRHVSLTTIDDFRALLHPDDVAMVEAHWQRLFAGAPPTRLQYRVVRPDGEIRWLDAFGLIERDGAGKAVLHSGAIQDITERKLQELAARSNENRFQLLFENSLDGVMQTTPDGSILDANSAACRIFGMSVAQMRERGRGGLVAADDSRLLALIEARRISGSARGELTMLRADGSRFEVELSSSSYTDADGTQINSMVLRDITDRIRSAQQIHRLAFFDALTELPNRRLLHDRMEQLLSAARHGGQVGAVLYLDLDHFKNVNDARGHATGDTLLRLVAQRLVTSVRSADTVARIGGDEFVILLPGLGIDFAAAATSAMAVADQIREALVEPFMIDGQAYGSGCSIGLALLPKALQTTEDLLREADTAMYRAKQAGRNRIAMFEAEMQSEVEHRLALEHDLAQAIGTAQIEMFLQPQCDFSGRAVGCELLMRWTHPGRGAVSPALFIPVAEESGLILRLGDWVVRQGCLAQLRLQQAGLNIPVSINVSPRQFRQADFVDRVRAILAGTGAAASQLIFEVTEGLLIDNLGETILRMNELVELGVRFSIDDFGTGYSSLAYLRRLPLYELKIDRSFVQDTPTDPGDTAIVQLILSMADHLGLRVVAEGVETHEQADFLHAAGCGSLQGYLFARPMPIDEWLARQVIAT